MNAAAKEAYVLAISGLSGSGKSLVVSRLFDELDDATKLHFDDYAPISIIPADLSAWLGRGAPIEEWKTPQLAADLAALRAGQTIEHPLGHGQVDPARIILVEEPQGKVRPEMLPLIDLSIYLDVPADILLARRLHRRITQDHDGPSPELVDQLERDLEVHVALGHRMHEIAGTAVAAAADVIIDAHQPPDTVVSLVLDELTRRLPKVRR